MLLVRRNNDFDWLNNWFDDNFFNTPVMAQTTTTAPAVNVKEDNKQYVMEVAVPGPVSYTHLTLPTTFHV